MFIDHVMVPVWPETFKNTDGHSSYVIEAAGLKAKRVNPFSGNSKNEQGSYIEYIEVKPFNEFFHSWLSKHNEGDVMMVAIRHPGEPQDGVFEITDTPFPVQSPLGRITEVPEYMDEELIFGIKDTTFPITFLTSFIVTIISDSLPRYFGTHLRIIEGKDFKIQCSYN